jgi:hypothetical protein
VVLANNFISKVPSFKSAIELLEIKMKQYGRKENWLIKFLPSRRKQKRFDYNKDTKLHSVTRMKILVLEDVLVYRQKFKSKYMQLSKEL